MAHGQGAWRTGLLVRGDGFGAAGPRAVGPVGVASCGLSARVTLALPPSSEMELTLPTGTSASCTWAPLDRSPTSLKTAVAARGRRPRPATPGQGDGRDRRAGNQPPATPGVHSQLPTSWTHCASRPRPAHKPKVECICLGNGEAGLRQTVVLACRAQSLSISFQVERRSK